MNQGIEILLSRMDSNPDEFVSSVGQFPHKWSWVLESICDRGYRLTAKKNEDYPDAVPTDNFPSLPFLTDDEILIVYKKLTSLQGKAFTDTVMKTLLDPEIKSEYDMARDKVRYVSKQYAVPMPGSCTSYTGYSGDLIDTE